MFEHGGIDLLIPELACSLGGGSADRGPEDLVLRKYVGDASGCLEILLLGHFSTILRAPFDRTSLDGSETGALLDFLIRSRGMAQSGSALDWGSRGHRFKSCCPDHEIRGITSIFCFVI